MPPRPVPLTPQRGKPRLEHFHALAQQSAIGFKLGLARTAKTDAAPAAPKKSKAKKAAKK